MYGSAKKVKHDEGIHATVFDAAGFGQAQHALQIYQNVGRSVESFVTEQSK